jgi:hypothetical protein
MLYLTGAGSAYKTRKAVSACANKLGYMLTPRAGYRLKVVSEYPFWAADNGCYSQGPSFDLVAYLRWLERMAPARQTCLFATAPDVVADALSTWARSKDVLPVLRDMGYKAALVAQDGIEDTDIQWDTFDALFMGGTTEYKLSETAYEVALTAKHKGKWLHMGRVNSRRRLLAAAASGYDSADGTHLMFGPDKRLPELVRWLRELERQPFLPFILPEERSA